MNRLLALLLAGLIALPPAIARAQEDEASGMGEEEDPGIMLFSLSPQQPKVKIDVTEYDNIPQGLLLDKEGDKTNDEIIAEEENETPEAGSQPQFTMTIEEVFVAYRRGEYEAVRKALEPMATSGHVGAQELLGVMYHLGQGVAVDHEKAAMWLMKAAEAGRPLAEHYLGSMYFEGSGVVKDHIKAATWLQIAVLHYKEGPEKDRARKDLESVSQAMTRRDRDRARDMVRAWLQDKGEGHLLEFVQ